MHRYTLADKLRDGEPFGRVSAPLDEPTAAWLMEPLRMGCLSDNAKVVEPALDCLHKLVAYSYLQDENTRSGRLDDQTTVAQVSRGSLSVLSKLHTCHYQKG